MFLLRKIIQTRSREVFTQNHLPQIEYVTANATSEAWSRDNQKSTVLNLNLSTIAVIVKVAAATASTGGF